MPPQRPLLVAHRAGNDLDLLAPAEAAGVDVIEADVHLDHGRLELRHLKRAGPLPLLWDRWTLAPASTPRPSLEALLRAVRPETHVLLDLKGIDRRLAAAVGRAVEREARCPVTVCSRTWSHLDRLGGEPAIGRVHSVGNRLQLRALRRRRLRDGVAVNARLLEAGVAAGLRERVPLLLSWPVRTLADARRLVGDGVTGLIVDDLGLLAAARRTAWS